MALIDVAEAAAAAAAAAVASAMVYSMPNYNTVRARPPRRDLRSLGAPRV